MGACRLLLGCAIVFEVLHHPTSAQNVGKQLQEAHMTIYVCHIWIPGFIFVNGEQQS